MVSAIRLILVVVVAGGAAFFVTRHFSAANTEGINEVAWLTQEFALDAQQSQKIAALHTAYQPLCADHCAAIVVTQNQIENALTDTDRVIANTALRELEQTCHESTRAHLEAVAAVMDSAQGQRYLDLIGPRLSTHAHAEPFGLK